VVLKGAAAPYCCAVHRLGLWWGTLGSVRHPTEARPVPRVIGVLRGSSPVGSAGVARAGGPGRRPPPPEADRTRYRDPGPKPPFPTGVAGIGSRSGAGGWGAKRFLKPWALAGVVGLRWEGRG
jgi:hypothetical protein